jgi:site-specific recombinase XerC
MLPARLMDQAADSIGAFLVSREATCNDKTMQTYGYYLRPFVRWLAGRPVSAALISAYLLERRRDRKRDDTLANTYRILKTWCRWMVAEGQLATDPFSGPGRVKPQARRRKRRRVYSDSEIVALLRATFVQAANKRRPELKRRRWADDGPYMREALQARALVLLLSDSALRAEEAARLTCGQVRAEEFLILGKGGHVDAAFVGATTRRALLELAAGREDECPLFRDWRGKACTTRAIRGILTRLSARAGVVLPPRPLHAFRHYAARQWVKAKIPDLAIRQLMRHSDLATTRIYTELDAAELAELHADASPIARLLAEAQADAQVY